jgi:molybdopterin-biosynthesis enzyme MoeA-like protein
MNNVFIMPGVPEAFRTKLNAVRAWVRGPKPFVSRAAFTTLDEAELKTLLDAVVARHSAVEVGSYPRWFEPSYKTKVTFDGRERTEVDAALADFVKGLPPGALVRSE